MARLTAVEAPAPFAAIQATKKEKTRDQRHEDRPGIDPLMKLG
jgi:hypothetical protein